MKRRQSGQRKQADTLLRQWDASISPVPSHKSTAFSERREFLSRMLKSGAVLSSIPLWSALSACDRRDTQQQLLQIEPWRSFAAVQQQLFPADGNGPSAKDVHATLYLKFVLEAADTDEGDKKFLLDGINWLNGLADKSFGKAFVALTDNEQARVLQQIANSRAGERWLSHLLLYIMEALLTDPVYGGNPAGIGWQWLEHQAGFPRPPESKRYTELL